MPDPVVSDRSDPFPGIHVITTGGSIDKEYTVAGNLEIGPPMAPLILALARPTFTVTVESACAKDSLDMDDQDRETIRRRVQACQARYVLITHGTDSMVQTAQYLLRCQDKVIVVTGSMQPARMTDTDAQFNVGLAVGALQCLDPGVYVAMSGRIFPAGRVIKDRAAGQFLSRPADS